MKRRVVRAIVIAVSVVALLSAGVVLASTWHKLPTKYIWQGEVEIVDDPHISVIACGLLLDSENIAMVSGVEVTLKNTANEDITCFVMVKCEDRVGDGKWTVKTNSTKKWFVTFEPFPLEELHRIRFVVTRIEEK